MTVEAEVGVGIVEVGLGWSSAELSAPTGSTDLPESGSSKLPDERL